MSTMYATHKISAIQLAYPTYMYKCFLNNGIFELVGKC